MTNEIRKSLGNKIKIFLILCLSVFLLLSQISFVQAINRTNFGIQEGDSYNFEVINDGRSNFSGRGSRTGDFTGIPSDFTRPTDFTGDFGGGGLVGLFGNLGDFEHYFY
ncbi:MAG: hypothetical protein HeimC3_21790 [Candidatus Heimdallarchaeota archaeon LC_3]|nr:MAG: hypothetical protein HeimC3_21790 [Candidatus Heimdallarchaeota archaeon LC_3]